MFLITTTLELLTWGDIESEDSHGADLYRMRQEDLRAELADINN